MKSSKLFFISFLVFTSFLFSNCTKENTLTSVTDDILVRNNWGVDYYFNNQDLTSNYGSYRILFSNTGLLAAQKDGQTVTGNWSSSLDMNNKEVIIINFNTADGNLLQLNRQWQIVNKTTTTMEFEEAGHGGSQDVFRIRKQ